MITAIIIGIVIHIIFWTLFFEWLVEDIKFKFRWVKLSTTAGICAFIISFFWLPIFSIALVALPFRVLIEKIKNKR